MFIEFIDGMLVFLRLQDGRGRTINQHILVWSIKQLLMKFNFSRKYFYLLVLYTKFITYKIYNFLFYRIQNFSVVFEIRLSVHNPWHSGDHTKFINKNSSQLVVSSQRVKNKFNIFIVILNMYVCVPKSKKIGSEKVGQNWIWLRQTKELNLRHVKKANEIQSLTSIFLIYNDVYKWI